MGQKLNATEIGQHVIDNPSIGFDQCSKCQGIEVQGTMKNVDDSEPFADELICDECNGLPEDMEVNIVPVTDEYGTSWLVTFANNKFDLEPDFESTADAEMWARDNGYTVVELELVEWEVPVTRIGIGFNTIRVKARSEQEAINNAIDEAGGESFSDNSSEYSAPDGAVKL